MAVPSYEAAGVNVAMGDQFVERLKRQAQRPGHAAMPKAAGGYAAVVPFTESKWMALSTDGVGTKVLLASEFSRHHGIGIDLVAMCANDLICVGARPTLFLDYFATGQLTLDHGEALIAGILDGCDQAGMLLIGGETAEMPDVYAPGHYDLAGFAVGELTPAQLLTGEAVRPGQTVIGLAASGIHSNGLSLARKLFHSPEELQLLLEPTRIYVKPVLALLDRFGPAITGMAHITGGGWRNLFRLNPAVGFEITDPLALPDVFTRLLARGITREEGLKTFNMGMGFALIVQDHAGEMVSLLQQAGISVQVVGRVTDEAGRLRAVFPEETLQLTHSQED